MYPLNNKPINHHGTIYLTLQKALHGMIFECRLVYFALQKT